LFPRVSYHPPRRSSSSSCHQIRNQIDPR
jgi:hypothetical protein